jgi:hypothetical protein
VGLRSQRWQLQGFNLHRGRVGTPDRDCHAADAAGYRIFAEQATVQCFNRHTGIKTKLTQPPGIFLRQRRPLNRSNGGRRIKGQMIETHVTMALLWLDAIDYQ